MTRPRKYRSKSVEREIRLYWGTGVMYVKSNHGDVPVQPGDYIITGDGEEYPITKEELEKRYDLVVDEAVEDKE
jgi:hypothetical protein